MPRKRRRITIILQADTTPDEYAEIANMIWSAVNATGKLSRVEHDDQADPAHLNSWYEKDGRQYRWGMTR
jgi:hypothetical protein